MSTYSDFLREELSNSSSDYARHFFDAAFNDFMKTGFFPAFLEATNLLIETRTDEDPELVREVYYCRGAVYFYIKNYEKAKADFESATQVESNTQPDDSEIELMMQVIAHYQGKPNDAKALLIDYWGSHSIAPFVTENPPTELVRKPITV